MAGGDGELRSDLGAGSDILGRIEPVEELLDCLEEVVAAGRLSLLEEDDLVGSSEWLTF
jgi:hypothetical protein